METDLLQYFGFISHKIVMNIAFLTCNFGFMTSSPNCPGKCCISSIFNFIKASLYCMDVHKMSSNVRLKFIVFTKIIALRSIIQMLLCPIPNKLKLFFSSPFRWIKNIIWLLWKCQSNIFRYLILLFFLPCFNSSLKLNEAYSMHQL